MLPYEITQVFGKKDSLIRVLKENNREAISSTSSYARSLCKSGGAEDVNLAQFSRMVAKEGASLEDKEVLSLFVRTNESNLDKLGLMSQITKTASKEAVRNYGLDNHSSIHNVLVTWKPEMAKKPEFVYSCRQIVTNRFETLSEEHVAPLENISESLDLFTAETSILIMPYLVGVLGFHFFSWCFPDLHKDNFFKSLFRGAVESIKKRVLLPFYTGILKSGITNVVLSACITSVGTYLFNHVFRTPVVVAAVAEPSNAIERFVVPEVRDPMEPYRFTGEVGNAIKLFKDTTGGILYTFCDLINTYRMIVVYTAVEPLLERSKGLFDYITGRR